MDCQKIVNGMIKDGKKTSTMTNLKSCLNAVFECAVDEDVILKNPARNLQIPQTGAKKRTAIESDQIKAVYGLCKDKSPVFLCLSRIYFLI
ncbi:MAG: hypothetical protein ACLVHS_03060 [Blautia wexlerae]